MQQFTLHSVLHIIDTFGYDNFWNLILNDFLNYSKVVLDQFVNDFIVQFSFFVQLYF